MKIINSIRALQTRDRETEREREREEEDRVIQGGGIQWMPQVLNYLGGSVRDFFLFCIINYQGVSDLLVYLLSTSQAMSSLGRRRWSKVSTIKAADLLYRIGVPCLARVSSTTFLSSASIRNMSSSPDAMSESRTSWKPIKESAFIPEVAFISQKHI